MPHLLPDDQLNAWCNAFGNNLMQHANTETLRRSQYQPATPPWIEVASGRVTLFALFGPPAITLLLFILAAFPYARWVTRKKPTRTARLAAVGSAAALVAYSAGTFYGLAYTHPLDLCATKTASGDYVDAGRDYSLTLATIHHFPPSVTCHWSSGHSTNDVSVWTTPLLYAGLSCATVCFTLILINRSHRRRAFHGNKLDA